MKTGPQFKPNTNSLPCQISKAILIYLKFKNIIHKMKLIWRAIKYKMKQTKRRQMKYHIYSQAYSKNYLKYISKTTKNIHTKIHAEIND